MLVLFGEETVLRFALGGPASVLLLPTLLFFLLIPPKDNTRMNLDPRLDRLLGVSSLPVPLRELPFEDAVLEDDLALLAAGEDVALLPPE